MTADLKRCPPESSQLAEKAVLSACLHGSPDVIAEVAMLLSKQDFYADGHQKLWDVILYLHDQSKHVDLVTVANELHRRGHIEDVGYPYLAALWEQCGAPSAATAYAADVLNGSVNRQLGHFAAELQDTVQRSGQPAVETLEFAEKAVFAIGQRQASSQTVVLDEAIQEVFERIDEATRPGGRKNLSVPTGLEDLDSKTTGLVSSEMVVLAARPSVGKTAMALAMASFAAVEHKAPIFFVSLEQTREELTLRLLCNVSGVDHKAARTGLLTDADVQRLVAARELMAGSPLHFDDTPSQTMRRIAANARRLVGKAGVRAVFIDYLQLIEPENRRDTRFEQVSQISRRIKLLARELKVPVVALAQINREAEKRADNKPRISDLRESGNIEADADTILLLSHSGNPEVITVDVAKQRNGPTGETLVRFDRALQRFTTYESIAEGYR